MAHTAGASLRLGIDEAKFEAVWEFRSSPLFTDAERIALEFTIAASSQPNEVTDEHFARMRGYWKDSEIVEITGVIALFGFLNRWNDTMASPLEKEPIEIGEKYLAKKGWSAGKHKA